MSGYNPTGFQQAIYQQLADDTELGTLVTGVHSSIPQHTDFPYVFLMVDDVEAYHSAQRSATLIAISVHCFSQTPGQAEIFSISERIYEVLHDSNPVISGHALVNLRFVSSDFSLLNDGMTIHNALRFRAVLEAA